MNKLVITINNKETANATIFEDGTTNIEKIQWYNKDTNVFHSYEGETAIELINTIFESITS